MKLGGRGSESDKPPKKASLSEGGVFLSEWGGGRGRLRLNLKSKKKITEGRNSPPPPAGSATGNGPLGEVKVLRHEADSNCRPTMMKSSEGCPIIPTSQTLTIRNSLAISGLVLVREIPLDSDSVHMHNLRLITRISKLSSRSDRLKIRCRTLHRVLTILFIKLLSNLRLYVGMLTSVVLKALSGLE